MIFAFMIQGDENEPAMCLINHLGKPSTPSPCQAIAAKGI
jgi:hypothetical protein